MKITFCIEQIEIVKPSVMDELRDIARVYFRDDVDVSFRVEDMPMEDAPRSGTFCRYADGTDEFIFD